MLNTRAKNEFLLELLEIKHKGLRHALLALISVIVSTLKGVEYIVTNDKNIIIRIIEILQKEYSSTSSNPSEDGSVN